MRTHVSLPDEMVEEIDEIVGPRERSAFIEEAVRLKLLNERQKRVMEKYKDAPGLDPEKYPYWATPELTSKWVHDLRREGEKHRLGKLNRPDD